MPRKSNDVWIGAEALDPASARLVREEAVAWDWVAAVVPYDMSLPCAVKLVRCDESAPLERPLPELVVTLRNLERHPQATRLFESLVEVGPGVLVSGEDLEAMFAEGAVMVDEKATLSTIAPDKVDLC